MNELDKSCYAYQSMKKYPIHTKEAALNSYAAFCKEEHTISSAVKEEIVKNFEKAAAYHEIKLEKPQEKVASATREYFNITTGDGNAIKISKIANSDDVLQATAFILEKRASMTRRMLKEAAKYVLWGAANTKLDLNSENMRKLARIAGIGVGDRENIQNELEKRATLNIFDGLDKEAFWKYANELKSLSDADFYKEANLNTVCDLIESIDKHYNNQHKYGTALDYPEDVVFGQNIDDLLKEASDLAYIESIDTTISKKALLERADKANNFFKEYFGAKEDLTGDKLINKVASLDKKTANALLNEIE